MTGDPLERDRRVFHRAGKWSDLIETGGEGHEPKPRDPPIGRLETDDATETGWLADRSSGIGSEADGGQTRGDCCGGSTAAAPGNSIGMPWVSDWFDGGVLVRRAHGELVRIGFPEKHRTLLAKAPDDRGVVRGP